MIDCSLFFPELSSYTIVLYDNNLSWRAKVNLRVLLMQYSYHNNTILEQECSLPVWFDEEIPEQIFCLNFNIPLKI